MIWRVSCECLLVLALRYLSRVKVQSWPFPQSRCYRWPAKVLASSRPLTNQIGMQYWITHTDQLWHWHTGTNCKGEKQNTKRNGMNGGKMWKMKCLEFQQWRKSNWVVAAEATFVWCVSRCYYDSIRHGKKQPGNCDRSLWPKIL